MSPSEREAEAVEGIAAACARIRAYTTGLDETAFLLDRKTADAVAMNLLVVGEAVTRLSPAVTANFDHIPWKDIIAFRHRIAHGYESLNFVLVWAVVSRRLADLEAVIDGLRTDPASKG